MNIIYIYTFKSPTFPVKIFLSLQSIENGRSADFVFLGKWGVGMISWE
jgi:hypothetical protein